MQCSSSWRLHLLKEQALPSTSLSPSYLILCEEPALQLIKHGVLLQESLSDLQPSGNRVASPNYQPVTKSQLTPAEQPAAAPVLQVVGASQCFPKLVTFMKLLFLFNCYSPHFSPTFSFSLSLSMYILFLSVNLPRREENQEN